MFMNQKAKKFGIGQHDVLKYLRERPKLQGKLKDVELEQSTKSGKKVYIKGTMVPVNEFGDIYDFFITVQKGNKPRHTAIYRIAFNHVYDTIEGKFRPNFVYHYDTKKRGYVPVSWDYHSLSNSFNPVRMFMKISGHLDESLGKSLRLEDYIQGFFVDQFKKDKPEWLHKPKSDVTEVRPKPQKPSREYGISVAAYS